MSAENPDLPFAPDLDSLCHWLATLPRNDREKRYSSLFAGLQALNGASLDPGFYFNALEEISVPIFQVAANLTSVVLGKPFPLELGLRKLAKLSAQFHDELARGYFKIAQEGGFGRDFDPEEQGKIIHSALRSYNQMVLRTTLMYEAIPSSLWRRINDLYRQAEQEGLSDWSESCPELSHTESASVEELYLRILVFRLVSPHRLEQAEIQAVFDLIQQHGKLVSLIGQPFEEGRKADFSVDLDSAAMPFPLFRQKDGVGEDLRYVSLGALRRLIRDLGRPPLNNDSGLSANLSNYIQIHLGAGLVPLPGKKSRMSIVIAGYSNLVHAMPHVRVKLESDEGFSDFKLLSPDEHVLPTARIESSKTTGTFSLSSSLAGQPTEASAGLWKSPTAVKCRVTPADTPGFYVIESPRVALPVGGLVGLFTDNKLIQFGVVCPGCNELTPHEYGFELLASEIGLVRVVFDTSPKNPHQCFFSGMGNGRFSLITPPLRMRGGEGLLVDGLAYGGSRERHRVARLLGKTAEYCQYELVSEAGVQVS